MSATPTCYCQRPLVQKDGVWVHQSDGLRRCYPDNTHPVDRQLRARPERSPA